MTYFLLILIALLLTYLVRITVKEIKMHITKETDRIITKINLTNYAVNRTDTKHNH